MAVKIRLGLRVGGPHARLLVSPSMFRHPVIQSLIANMQPPMVKRVNDQWDNGYQEGCMVLVLLILMAEIILGRGRRQPYNYQANRQGLNFRLRSLANELLQCSWHLVPVNVWMPRPVRGKPCSTMRK